MRFFEETIRPLLKDASERLNIAITQECDGVPTKVMALKIFNGRSMRIPKPCAPFHK